MRHFMRFFLMASLGIFLTLGCSSITSESDIEIDEQAEVGELNGIASSTTKSKFKDDDDNGIPDEGEVVTGAYKALYAFDANGDYYFDLGDGREQGTVSSVSDLEKETLSVCKYKVQYRGGFENDPFLDNGWVKNNINCNGYAYDKAYTENYTIVHKTDSRYTGEKPATFGGDWEYHVYTIGGQGNVVRPENPVGN